MSLVVDDESQDIVIQAGVCKDPAAVPAASAAEGGTARDGKARPQDSAAPGDVERMRTTEDDLHAPVPFAKMRRYILAAALVALVAFAAYWLTSHPL